MFRYPAMPQTIGQQLKQTRQEKALTIQKVVQATRIRAVYIEAIETDDFESLPSPVQVRAFLRLYAEYLGLSLEAVISLQQTDVSSTTLETSLNPPVVEKITTSEVSQPPQPVSNLFLKRLGSHFVRHEHPISDVSPEPVSPKIDQIVSEKPISPPDEVPDDVHTAPAEPKPSQLIFVAIGETLRQRRESLSLILEEIERHTHVRIHYLQALEAGELDKLPSSVQARGMLSNYARFLDMDVDQLLLRFADGLQVRRVERQTALELTSQKPLVQIGRKTSPHTRIKIPGFLSRIFSVDILVGGGLIILLLLFSIWGTSRIIGLRSATTPAPTAPSIADVLDTSPEAGTATPSLAANGTQLATVLPVAGETLAVTIPVSGQGNVHVVVIANDQAWVRVTVDFVIKFTGRVTAGMAYPYDGNTQIEVLTGNGLAISILYNQSTLGPMGNLGDVVDRIYTAKAILEPTATFTPTPSITPTPSATLKPSATPRISATPKASVTPTP